ncbi:MAG: ABC transporter permease, partial [Terriglobales bacterium]
MSTQVATFPATAPASAGVLLPAFTLWWREVVRFYRQRARVVGVILSPLLFWIVIGSGFGTSFRSGQAAGQQHYLDYFYPGTLVMIILFTAIFTMMSVIEDRNEGFLLSVLVAPVPRAAIVLGKVLGGTTLAAAQGLIFLIFAPFVGVHFTFASFGLIVLTVFLVSFALTALGFAIAWPMDS